MDFCCCRWVVLFCSMYRCMCSDVRVEILSFYIFFWIQTIRSAIKHDSGWRSDEVLCHRAGNRRRYPHRCPDGLCAGLSDTQGKIPQASSFSPSSHFISSLPLCAAAFAPISPYPASKHGAFDHCIEVQCPKWFKPDIIMLYTYILYMGDKERRANENNPLVDLLTFPLWLLLIADGQGLRTYQRGPHQGRSLHPNSHHMAWKNPFSNSHICLFPFLSLLSSISTRTAFHAVFNGLLGYFLRRSSNIWLVACSTFAWWLRCRCC